MTKLLTPEEVLQAITDNKSVEYNEDNYGYWCLFKPSQWDLNDLLSNRYTFRLAQEMISIGDVSFPKPIAEELPEETIYYYPSIECHDLFNTDVWRSLPMDYRLLQRGLIHLDVRDAIAHSKALIKLSGGSYE